MPTYEYECSQCGGHFDIVQRMSDPPQKICDICGGALAKLLSTGSGLIFKGSGFYITDYKNAGAPGGKGEKGEGGEKSESSEKTDSRKPDSKREGALSAEKTDSKSSESKPESSPATGTDKKIAPSAAKQAEPQ